MKTVEQIAMVCHQVNKAYCESIRDFTQADWYEAPDWQQISVIKGVETHIENPFTTPEESHESWLREKAKTGWTWGAEKDPIKKTHPCMKAYDELPAEQRTKDHLFKAVVQSMVTCMVVEAAESADINLGGDAA
jgi:hypothetical protein